MGGRTAPVPCARAGDARLSQEPGELLARLWLQDALFALAALQAQHRQPVGEVGLGSEATAAACGVGSGRPHQVALQETVKRVLAGVGDEPEEERAGQHGQAGGGDANGAQPVERAQASEAGSDGEDEDGQVEGSGQDPAHQERPGSAQCPLGDITHRFRATRRHPSRGWGRAGCARLERRASRVSMSSAAGGRSVPGRS